MLHFAYGANLCKFAMRMRCPAAAALCTAVLPGYRLVFRKYADVEPAAGATVQGALCVLSPACKVALDHFDGIAGGHYRQERLLVRRAGGGEIEALVYRRNGGGYAPPPEAYLDIIRQGYANFALDEAALRLAVD